MDTFSVAKITFVVAVITFTVALITYSVVEIIFVGAEITFKLALVTSSVAKITFVVAGITFKVLVITSSVAKITFVVAEITRCWYIFFKFWNSLGKNVEHSLFSLAGRKVLKFYVQPKKCVMCSNSSLFFIPKGLFQVNNRSRTCLNQNWTFITYKNQLREKYSYFLLKKYVKSVKLIPT